MCSAESTQLNPGSDHQVNELMMERDEKCQSTRGDEGVKKKPEPEGENEMKDCEEEDGSHEKEKSRSFGETDMEVRKRKRTPVKNGKKSGDGLEDRGQQWTEVISLKPRASIYHNFLSKKECKHLISLAKPHLKRATVYDPNTGKWIISRGVTSSAMSLKRGHDKVIMDIEKRIACYTTIPIERGKGIHVLHYKKGQRNNAHHDYLPNELLTINGGQCMATLLMYLSDVKEGGETIFPKAEGNNLMSCGKNGLSVKPKMGDALLFWNLQPDLTIDPSSLHASCPVTRGSKWAATKRMYVGEV